MAQYNLFNPNDVRVGLLIFYSSNMERAWRNRTYVLNSNPNSNYQRNSRTRLKVECK